MQKSLLACYCQRTVTRLVGAIFKKFGRSDPGFEAPLGDKIGPTNSVVDERLHHTISSNTTCIIEKSNRNKPSNNQASSLNNTNILTQSCCILRGGVVANTPFRGERSVLVGNIFKRKLAKENLHRYVK